MGFTPVAPDSMSTSGPWSPPSDWATRGSWVGLRPNPPEVATWDELPASAEASVAKPPGRFRALTTVLTLRVRNHRRIQKWMAGQRSQQGEFSFAEGAIEDPEKTPLDAEVENLYSVACPMPGSNGNGLRPR